MKLSLKLAIQAGTLTICVLAFLHFIVLLSLTISQRSIDYFNMFVILDVHQLITPLGTGITMFTISLTGLLLLYLVCFGVVYYAGKKN